MEMNRLWKKVNCALIPCLVLVACVGSETGVAGNTPANVSSSPPPGASASPHSDAAPVVLEAAPSASVAASVPVPSPVVGAMASEDMAAPLVLTLRGPEPVPSKGDIKLDLDIVTREPMRAPVTLKVIVPAGASLAGGKLEEVLQIPNPGTIHREFVVRSTGALGGSIVVSADMKTASSGLHAERKYPNVMQSPAQTLHGPKPPVPRPSGPPR